MGGLPGALAHAGGLCAGAARRGAARLGWAGVPAPSPSAVADRRRGGGGGLAWRRARPAPAARCRPLHGAGLARARRRGATRAASRRQHRPRRRPSWAGMRATPGPRACPRGGSRRGATGVDDGARLGAGADGPGGHRLHRPGAALPPVPPGGVRLTAAPGERPSPSPAAPAGAVRRQSAPASRRGPARAARHRSPGNDGDAARAARLAAGGRRPLRPGACGRRPARRRPRSPRGWRT